LRDGISSGESVKEAKVAVYVDRLRKCKPNKKWRWTESCHLFAGSLEELHNFAASLGLKREYFQNTRIPHYDLTKGKRMLAIRLGAKEKEVHANALL